MHTKGSWKIEPLETSKNGYEDWNTYTIRSPQNVCLAVVGDVDRYHEKDHEENARLIAAAPDLLEACKALLEMITDNRLHGQEVYNAAQAISKAEKGE